MACLVGGGVDLLCVRVACCHQDSTNRVVQAAAHCQELSKVAQYLCRDASSSGERMVVMSSETTTSMRGFNTDDIGPKIFEKIQYLMDHSSNRTESLQRCEEMADFAKQTIAQAEDMGKSLKEAIDSLPDPVKDDYEPPPTTTRGVASDDLDDELKGMINLVDVDADIAELEDSTQQSRGGLNLFSAATLGTSVFEKTQEKGQVCRTLFSQMKDLCQSLVQLAATIVTGENCCKTVRAVLDGIASLFRCSRLVELLATAARAALRLVLAIADLIRLAWQKISAFREEFRAAKKIGKFVHGVKKVGKFGKKVGKLGIGLVEGFLDKD